MASLSEALNDVATRSEAADLLRGLIEKVLPHPDPTALHDHRIELFGELAAILSLCNVGLSTNAKARTGVVRAFGK